MLIKEEGTKANFIDERDKFVGYDTGTDCCEHAGWFISDKEETEIPETEGNPGFDLKNYYFEGITLPGKLSDTDEGSSVVFPLIHIIFPPLYLHLFNVHNGYYGHGVDTNVVEDDITL